MDEYDPSRDNALLQAVRVQNIDGVRRHSSTGLNDVPFRTLSHNAACYLRFGPTLEVGYVPPALSAPYYQREDVLLAVKRPQLTKVSRFQDCTRFWTGIGLTSRYATTYSDSIPTVIEAAQGSSLPIVDLLCEAGAKLSFWKSEPFEIPLEATPSSLAVTTPLHAAIWSRNTVGLDHLLTLDFNADAMPLAYPTRCITPLMATVVYCNPGTRTRSIDYIVILQKKAASILTKGRQFLIYKSCILPQLGLTLSSYVAFRTLFLCIKTKEPALGHTLLHVACLPLNEKYTQMHSKGIYNSIHDIQAYQKKSPRQPTSKHATPRTTTCSLETTIFGLKGFWLALPLTFHLASAGGCPRQTVLRPKMRYFSRVPYQEQRAGCRCGRYPR